MSLYPTLLRRRSAPNKTDMSVCGVGGLRRSVGLLEGSR